MKLKFKRLTSAAIMPKFAHATDSGMDIYSVECRKIFPGSGELFATGIAAEIPNGYELQVRPRSGLQCKHGIVGGFGTIDEGYRGEIRVVLFNFSNEVYTVNMGERIAQLVLAPVVRPEIEETTELSTDTDRGIFGFGSTGK